jgi:Na+/H+ antiporter NhaC
MDYGWWSVAPPVVAIVLAILTRRVVASLLLGAAVGVIILQDWSANANPAIAVGQLLETHLWTSLAEEDHLRVFAFTALMGAMIGVIHRCGGMLGVVNLLAPLARSRRGGQLLTWVLGLLIFIDDYANSLLLGHTMRPLADRLRISREKLAYLVDSTAAPVAGLALVSTWVAGEIGYIESGFAGLDLPAGPVDGFGVFIATIPYRFYVLWALLLVPLVALTGRDFGPMLDVERRLWHHRHPGSRAAQSAEALPDDSIPPRWYNALVPIAMTLVVTVWLLVLTGGASAGSEPPPSLGWRGLVQVFGQGDSYLSLVYGSLAGLLTAVLLARLQGIMTFAEARSAAMGGARLVLPALVILWLAWTLSGITGKEHLGTGEFLGSILQQAVDVRWMPSIVFVLASFVAFSTGTSWGTMGILMPIVVTTTFRMLQLQTGAVDPHSTILTASIGGVLAGAIFGDHCSPISDTTVLSSQASGCNHVQHVWTQLPYALVVAVVSILCGTLPVGFGVSVWPALALGSVVLVLVFLVLSRSVEAAP